MVRKQQVYELRLKLANHGLPGNSGIGFEIFDRSSLPGTEFSNQINLQRALQGELSRSINSLDEVMASRVHLVLPRKSLYSDDTEASASVVLTLQPGRTLSQGQVQGLVNLVAAAVEGLKPQAVTVVDAGGHILYSGLEGGDSAGLTTVQIEARQQFEEGLRQRLQSMLDAVVGQHRAVVRVQAELSLDTEQVQSEVYSEPVGTQGGLRSAHIVEESYEGSRRPGALAGGVSANIEGQFGTELRSGAGAYTSREETRQYELSREVTERSTAAGAIKRLTVAAIVDQKLGASEVEKVRQALEAASGYSEERGDRLVIQSMPLAVSEAADEAQKQADAAAEAERRAQQLAAFARYGSAIGAVLILAAAMLITSRQIRNALGVTAMRAETDDEVAEAEVTEASASAADAPAGDDTEDVIDVVHISEGAVTADSVPKAPSSSEDLAEIVRKIAAERPEAVARQVERWLAES
jgi:flagellar M-ring protein FliF